MKILFYRYNSICEPDMMEAFRSYGLTVVEETSEMTDKHLTSAQRIENLKLLLDRDQYLFVFSINFFPAVSELCQIYQVLYLCYSVDAPLAEIYSKSVLHPCNRLFLFDRQQYESLSKYNSTGIFHLPLATNPERWKQITDQITSADHTRYACDISFIGSLYTEKDPWLKTGPLPDRVRGFADGLTSAQLKLTGCSILEESLTDEVAREIVSACPETFADNDHSIMNMDRYVAGQHILGMHASSLYRIQTLSLLAQSFGVDLYTASPIPDSLNQHLVTDNQLTAGKEKNGIRLCGTANTLTEMPKIFHLSRINLYMTIYPIRSGLSLRIWDVLGCGGFLLTNCQPELTEHFVPGEDLDTFSCPEELVEKCRFYLSHEEIRSRIAAHGYEKVCAHHTWKKRFEAMLRCIS